MKCKLERNFRLEEILHTLITGYTEGDFTEFFPYLSEDCQFSSMWVMETMVGRERIIDYLTGKGETIRRSGSFPECTIVQLVGNVNSVDCDAVHLNGSEARPGRVGLWYEDGKYALLMEQTIDGRTNGVLLDLSLNEQGMVKKLALCEPSLFAYESIPEQFCLEITAGDPIRESSLIRIPMECRSDLVLFLEAAGSPDDPPLSDDAFPQREGPEEERDGWMTTAIPLDRWRHALDLWMDFCEAENFDDTFEALAGVRYDTWTVDKPSIANRLTGNGLSLWKNRARHEKYLQDLLEWMALYETDHDTVWMEEEAY